MYWWQIFLHLHHFERSIMCHTHTCNRRQCLWTTPWALMLFFSVVHVFCNNPSGCHLGMTPVFIFKVHLHLLKIEGNETMLTAQDIIAKLFSMKWRSKTWWIEYSLLRKMINLFQRSKMRIQCSCLYYWYYLSTKSKHRQIQFLTVTRQNILNF